MTIKLISLERAVDTAQEVARDFGLGAKQEHILQWLVSSCSLIEQSGVQYLRFPELHAFLSNFQKALRSKDSSFLLQKRGLCVDKIVDMEEFCESPEYMDQRGYIWPKIMEKLVELDEGNHFVEAVLTGAIGIGKNYFSDLYQARMLYKLSCYHNPQLEHDLAPGSSIIFIQQSKTATLAKKVVFEQFAERLRLSPYFRNIFPFDPNIKSELRFPKQITVLPIGGTDTAALGMNVYGGIIDELNFMARVKDSVETRYTGEEEYDQAQKTYTTLIRRMVARFEQMGKLPGKLLLVSSSNYPGDFTSRKKDEVKEELAKTGRTSIFVMDMALWEAVPKERLLPGRFLVEVGDEFRRSRIIKSMDEAQDPEDVIEVPDNYRRSFELDVDAALKDLGGIATGTRRAFIQYREGIRKAQEEYERLTEGRRLFKLDEVCLNTLFAGEEESPDWEKLVNLDYIEDVIINRNIVFAGHIDVALSGDAAGFALGRIVGYKLLPSMKYYNERAKEFVEIRDIRAPMYMIDGVLRILPPLGDEIDLDIARDLIMFLRGELNLKWCTMDSYQAPHFYQAFRKVRIKSGIMSVDETIAPYTEYKLALKDERIWMPPHEVLAKETREVEKDPQKEKVDHPPGGSKDCSDAVAGVLYILQRKEANYGRARTSRETTPAEQPQVRHIRMKSRQQEGGRQKIGVKSRLM